MGIKNSGFTLIEMLMVIGVISVVMPAVMSISYVILSEQLRIYRITETKRQGDYIMNVMKEKIARDAEIIFDNSTSSNICDDALDTFSSPQGTTLDFFNEDNELFKFSQVNGNLVVNDNTVLPSITSNLNDGRVSITNFVIECSRKTLLTRPLVGFAYDVTFVDATPTAREGTITLHYQTRVKLR
ncbi:MAG: type II secretion system protein [bacterium]|nr:type II secretion system protein [bacterium]